MDRDKSACVTCGGRELFATTTEASGPLGPDLLPGIGSILRGARLELVVCASCGHLELGLPEKSRKELAGSKKWRRLE